MKIDFFKEEWGQATIELAVMFPVLIIVAAITVNALTFFSECAEFDRTFKQIVAAIGSNPGYGKNIDNTKMLIEDELEGSFNKNFLEFDVEVENVSGDLQSFSGEIRMHPTLFGMGLRDYILGVPLPLLKHKQKLVIEQYRPGVIF